MKRHKKLGSKLIALVLSLMLITAYVPMLGENVYAADSNYPNAHEQYGISMGIDKYEYEYGEDIRIQISGSAAVHDWAANPDGLDEFIGIYYTNTGDTFKETPLYKAYTGDGCVEDGEFTLTNVNVAPGTYYLHLMATNDSGAEGRYTTVSITILPVEGGDVEQAETFIEVYKDASAAETTSEYKVGDTVYVRANCADSAKKASTWFGLYRGEWDLTTIDNAGDSIFYDYARNGYDGDGAKDMLASSTGVQQNWDKNLTAGTYTLVLFTTDSKPYEKGAYKQFTVVDNSGSGEEPDTPPVDPYEGYDIIVEPEDTLTPPIVREGVTFENSFTQGFPEGINIKVVAPEGADANMWVGMYDIVDSLSSTSTAWQTVTFAGTTAENAQTINIHENWNTINRKDLYGMSGYRQLVLYADGGFNKIADIEYIYVKPNEKDAIVNLEANELTYNGETQKAVVKNVVFCSDSAHGHAGATAPTSTYEVVNEGGKDAGTYYVNVNFNNRYGGTATATYTIVPKAFDSVTVEEIADQEFTKEAVTPEVVVKDGETVLVKDKDYTVSYANNVGPTEEAKVTVTGKGNYTETAVTKTFKIVCDHNYVAEVTGETCTTDGYTTFTCSKCEDTYTGEETAKHTQTHVAREEATCVADGNIEYWACSCGVNYADEACTEVADNVVLAKHTQTHVAREEATCVADGNIEYWACSCGVNYADEACTEVADNVVLAKHTQTHVAREEATCVADGNIEYWACSCGVNYADEACTKVADNVVLAKHTQTHNAAVAKTCEKDGNIEYWACSCGVNYADEACTKAVENVVVAKGHDYKTVVTPPTCTEDGTIVEICDCGDVLKASEGEVATGHTEVADPAVDATYFAPGKTAGAHCSVCQTVITAQEEVPALKYEAVPAKATVQLRTVSGGYNDVKFSWDKVEGANGYAVYYKKATANTYTKLTDTTATSVTKNNLTAGARYYFKVVPYVQEGDTVIESAEFKTANLYTLKRISTPKVVKKGTKVKVSWTNINGETGYQISRSTKKNGTNIVATYKTTTAKYKNVTAKKGVKYYYKVRAYKTVKVGKKDVKVFGPWSYVKAYKRK